ncbi:MAG: arginine repressor, partial [Parabacteroides sp.]|nr:arginine repressor [Parabacteroides sp.]
MSGRISRLDIIKRIISSKEIGSQDELLTALKKEGYNTT